MAPRLYKIRHHHLSHDHKFEIESGTNGQLYVVHSTPRSLSGQLFLCEAFTNKELMIIQENTHSLHSSYDILSVTTNDDKDTTLATVRRVHSEHHFHKALKVDSVYGVYQVEHTTALFGHELKITTGNKTVANVTKHAKFPENENVYQAEINDDDGGDTFLLALIVALWRA